MGELVEVESLGEVSTRSAIMNQEMLPKMPSGKIQRYLLRSQVEQEV